MNEKTKNIYFADITAIQSNDDVNTMNTYAFLSAKNQAEAEELADDVTALWNEQDRNKELRYERSKIVSFGLLKAAVIHELTIWTKEEIIKELRYIDIGVYTLEDLLLLLKEEFPKTVWTVKTLLEVWNIMSLKGGHLLDEHGWKIAKDVITEYREEIVELIGNEAIKKKYQWEFNRLSLLHNWGKDCNCREQGKKFLLTRADGGRTVCDECAGYLD